MNTKIDSTQSELEALKAEIAKKEQELLEAKREEARIAREKELEERIKKEHEAANANRAKYVPHAKKVIEALKAIGHNDAVIIEEDGSNFPAIHPNGNKEYKGITIKFEFIYSSERYSFRSHVKGVRIQVGNYYDEGNKKYPQRKDGTFNYEAIAKTYKDLIDARVQKANYELNKAKAIANNKARVKRLEERFGKRPYENASYKRIHNVGIAFQETSGHGRDFVVRSYPDNFLKFVIRDISEENIAKLLEFMETEGMLEEKK